MGKTYTVEEWFEVTDLTQPKKIKLKNFLKNIKNLLRQDSVILKDPNKLEVDLKPLLLNLKRLPVENLPYQKFNL